MSEDKVEIQVKVPMCLTITLDREDAEWMFRDQLAEVIDGLLSQCSTEELKEITTKIYKWFVRYKCRNIFISIS